MKKFLMFMMASVLLLGATSCNSCKREKQTIGNTIISDYNYMSETHDGFVWYESQITLCGYLDEGKPTEVKSVSNVFQYVADGQPSVVVFTHYNGKCDTTIHGDFWIEDCAMTPDDVKITFDEAYEWLMKANLPKPHSRNCILREPVGPYACNPQYVFGNIHEPVFVDAVTGKVVDTNPAFIPKE